MFNTIWDFIVGQVSANQFLAGGAVLGAIGFLIAYLKSLPGVVWAWFKRRIIIEIDVPDKDESFQWLDEWLTRQRYQQRCRLLTVCISRKRRERNNIGMIENDYDSRTRPEIRMSPAPGTHYFFYKRRLIILRRDRKDGADQKGSIALGYKETFNIKLFSRNRQLVIDLLEEAREISHPASDDRISVYLPSYGDWLRASKKLPRPIESVILAEGLSDRMLTAVKEFQESETWYNDLGIPYRLGCLLYGPPGNGKSSIVMAVASVLRLDICVLNLSSSGLSDDRLIELMTNIPAGSILLIEDIDCVFNNRDKKDDKDTVTFSGLLNAIDGVMAAEGRVLFLTTNHVEKLDPALIRPGRCDMRIEVDHATPQQAEKLFLRFYPAEIDRAVAFGSMLRDGVSMADCQGHLLQNRNDANKALTSWKSVIDLKYGEIV